MGKFEKVEEGISVLLFVIIATIAGTGILFYLNVIGAFLVKNLWSPLLYMLWAVSCIILFFFFKMIIDEQQEVEKLKEEVKLLTENLANEVKDRKKSDREKDDEIKRLSHNSDLLYRQTTELRSVTGLDIQKTEQDAQKAILDSVQ